MLLDLIKSRHSIRKYTDQQVPREAVEKILEAGVYAPSAGGGQRSMLVAVRNAQLTRKIGIMNMAKFNRANLVGSYVSKDQPSVIDDPTIRDGFYGAPTVIAIFAQKNFLFRDADSFCCAENMILQASELGIASCIISRGPETFESEEGKALLKEWQIPNHYICTGFVILGYIDGEQPTTKPRKNGRSRIVE
jgi:nitroreductase